MTLSTDTLGLGPHQVLIGLGANLGDPDFQIGRAIELLGESDGVRVISSSAIQTFEPVGGPPQPDYRNSAALLETSLAPTELLFLLKDVEKVIGRSEGGPRWGPRMIDLDILLFGDMQWDAPDLTIPHPRMQERRFVLEPASEIAPRMLHPVARRTVRELLMEIVFHEAPTRGEE